MKTLKNFGIIGMGMYVPSKKVTNADFEKIVDTSDKWITKMTGIKERRRASDEEATSDLAYNSAVKALEAANITAEDLDLIVVATVTPDYFTPSVSAILQNKLGATKAAAFDINAACSGFVYALQVAGNFITTGMYKKVLVVGAEIFSRHTDWNDRNTCILFGDGAASAVLSEVEEGYGVLGSYLKAVGNEEVLIIPGGGTRHMTSKESIKENLHCVKMNGPEVFKFAVNAMPTAVDKVLELTNINIKDLDFIIPHQANIRIIESAAKRLNFPKNKFVINLEKYGNTSSASIGLALCEALEKKMIKKGDKLVLVGFGAGLTYASCFIKWAY